MRRLSVVPVCLKRGYTLEKRISGGRYAFGLGKRFAIFVAVTLGFPFFIYGVIQISGAHSVSGASGALALVLGLYLKPIIYIALACSTLRISLKRAHTIGISPAIGLCIPLLVLADLSFGIAFGSFWAVGFTLGIIGPLFPASLLAAVITVVTLSLLREIEEPMIARMASIYGIWKVLLFILLALGLAGMLPMLSVWFLGVAGLKLNMLFIQATAYLRVLLIYPYGLLLVFAAASATLIMESRRSSGTGEGRRMTSSARTTTPTQSPLFGRKT